MGLPLWLSSKESTCSAGDTEMWVPSLGREDPLEKEMAKAFQYSCPGNPMDRGAWWTTVLRGRKELDTSERLHDNNVGDQHGGQVAAGGRQPPASHPTTACIAPYSRRGGLISFPAPQLGLPRCPIVWDQDWWCPGLCLLWVHTLSDVCPGAAHIRFPPSYCSGSPPRCPWQVDGRFRHF